MELAGITPQYLKVVITLFIVLSCRYVMAGDDVVVLKNGDRITGEIKKIELGTLHVDADYGDNVFQIKWEEVEKVETEQRFVGQTSDGRRLEGEIQTDSSDAGRVLLEDAGQTTTIDPEGLVSLTQVDEGFWSRFSASIDFGLSLTAANENRQLNARSSAAYRTEDWSLEGTFNSLLNSRKDVPRTKRNEGGVVFLRPLTQKWFTDGFGKFLQSDELGLDLRSTIGGGAGRYLLQTNQWTFSLFGGAAWTNENFTSTGRFGTDQNSAEGMAGVELNGFNLSDVNVLSRYVIFPSLTESGRVRMDFNVDFKWDLPRDLYFSVGFTQNYDSAPPGDRQKIDYVFNTSVGWAF